MEQIVPHKNPCNSPYVPFKPSQADALVGLGFRVLHHNPYTSIVESTSTAVSALNL